MTAQFLLGAYVFLLAILLGFELIGSAVALVGAGAGGILVFFGFLNWQEKRNP